MSADLSSIRTRLAPFTGNAGGIDSWLVGQPAETSIQRIAGLQESPISCSQLNQLLALSHQAEVSEGAFRYYWLATPVHTYDVTGLPHYHRSYVEVDRILSLDQLTWGLYRLYHDCLLYYGSIRNGYHNIRSKRYDELDQFLHGQAVSRTRYGSSWTSITLATDQSGRPIFDRGAGLQII